jgi:hypothetical protein
MPEHFIDLLLPVLLLFTQFSVAQRFVSARVGLQLSAVDRHMPQLHQSCLLTRVQRLNEQTTEALQMLLPETCDRVVIWMLIGRQIAKRYIVVCGLFNASRDRPSS